MDGILLSRSTDAELVAQIRVSSERGCPSDPSNLAEDAFRVLLERYWKVVVVLAESRVQCRRDAEDIAQEAFLRAWRSIDGLEKPKHFLGWLLTIVRNLSSDRLRRRKPMSSLDAMESASDTIGDLKAASVESRIERDEQWEIVTRALSDLPDRYRTVVILRYLRGLSSREMADSLGEPEGTIRNRLFRALAKLRDRLSTDALNQN